MKNQTSKDTRPNLLAALFVKAKNRGIEADELREDIAPAIIGKRLSEATAQEIVRVIEHVTKLYKTSPPLPPHPTLSHEGRGEEKRGEKGRTSSPFMGGAKDKRSAQEDKGEGKFKRYPSSRPGLIEELTDAARARWGAEFERPLNEFVNHNRPTQTHYKFLKVTDLKALKNRINELNEQGKR